MSTSAAAVVTSSASVPDLKASLRESAQQAGTMLEEMLGFVEEYLSEDGPLAMLEAGVGGPGQERLEFHGRVQYPERLHVVAMVIDVTTRLLADLERYEETTGTADAARLAGR